MDHFLRPSGDISSIAVIVATFLGYLPVIAAGASLIWTVMRIYETYLSIKRLKKKKS